MPMRGKEALDPRRAAVARPRQLAAKVHRDLAGVRDMLPPAAREQFGAAQMEHARNRCLDLGD